MTGGQRVGDPVVAFARLNHVHTDAFNRQNRTIGTSEITP